MKQLLIICASVILLTCWTPRPADATGLAFVGGGGIAVQSPLVSVGFGSAFVAPQRAFFARPTGFRGFNRFNRFNRFSRFNRRAVFVQPQFFRQQRFVGQFGGPQFIGQFGGGFGQFGGGFGGAGFGGCGY